MDLLTAKPKLTGNVQKDVKSLSNHVFQLEEQLRYQLRNLDVTNFNDLGLARYENGRLQVYSEVVEIQTKKLSAEVKNTTDGLSSKIEQTDNEISAIVQSVGANGKVTAASIVASINNQGTSAVKIQADKVDLTGVVTVKGLATAGQTIINADNILTGTVKGVSFIAKGDIDVTGETSNSFVVQSPNTNSFGENYTIGKIGYTYVAADPTETEEKLYIKTEQYLDEYLQQYRSPAVKIFGAGGVSIETPGGVYTFGNEYVTMASYGGLQIQDLGASTFWEFRDGGLFKNGAKVL